MEDKVVMRIIVAAYIYWTLAMDTHRSYHFTCINSIFATAHWGSYYHHHFINEETETQTKTLTPSPLATEEVGVKPKQPDYREEPGLLTPPARCPSCYKKNSTWEEWAPHCTRSVSGQKPNSTRDYGFLLYEVIGLDQAITQFPEVTNVQWFLWSRYKISK